MEDPAAKFFSPKATERDRAVFEAGVALGMVMHQFRGIPLKSNEDAELLERVIERAVRAQPFKESARVRIARRFCHDPSNPYDYSTLKNSDLDVEVVVRYGGVVVRARARRVDELGFNLAYIEDICEGPGCA